jgi:tripartite-type tricarboxylate transporter receptor subunit TctC
VDRLAAEVAGALKDPALRTRLQSTGGNPEPSTPPELAERIRQITAKMRKVIQDGGITGE